MENQIITFSGRFYKSFMITNDALWLSQSKHKTHQKFESEIQKTGILQSAKNIPLSTISNITYNNAQDYVKLKYKNHRNEEKKLDIEFNDKKLSSQFSHFLGNKLEMTEEQKKEVKWKPFLKNLFWLLLTIGFTYYVVSKEDSNELLNHSSGKSKAFALLIKLILDYIGKTGVIALASIISVSIIYFMIKRFRKPSTITTFQQKLF